MTHLPRLVFRNLALFVSAALLILFVSLFIVPFTHTLFDAVGASLGESLPALTLKNQDGQDVKIQDLRGHFVLFYFYPKDDTPGCTKQACSLRDSFAQYKKQEILVYGVSTQGVSSHQAFKSKHHLPFDLLADENGQLGQALGIKKIPILGIYRRQSVLISPEGKVAKFFESVDPATHSASILEAVRELRAGASAVSPPPAANKK